MRCFDRSKQRICYSSVAHRSVLKGWQLSHVHVRTALFCIPTTLCGEHLPVSTQIVFTHCDALASGAIRFLFWWLFLHRRLRSRQRGPRVRSFRRTSFRLGGVALIWLIISNECSSFLSEQLRLTLLSSLASLSASAPSVPGSGFPLLLPSSDRVTTFAPPLGAGQSAREQPRLCNHPTPIIFRVK